MEADLPFAPGDLVVVEGFQGYAVVSRVTPFGDVFKVDLIFPDVKETRDAMRTVMYPLQKIEKLSNALEMAKSGRLDPAWKLNLLTDAYRFSLAHEYDPFFALSVSRIDVLPHQIDAVYRMIGSFEQRFLLADDAGLGKTIMAGMIIKELEARGRAKRVLLVVPAPLQFQWRHEMLENFDERFDVYTSTYVNGLTYGPSENPWERSDKIVTSLDYAKRESVMAQLERTKWDLIVFDEAHKLSASKSGDKVERSDRFRLAELLKDKTEALLLLTATPHKGDPYAFYALLSLLDPYLFPDEEHVDRKKLGRVMIRRLKEDALDFDGKKLFPPREVRTLPVEYTPKERKLYEAVTSYVTNSFNMAKATGNRNVGFAMVILQKRMVSSVAAITKSLARRRDKLQELLKLGEAAGVLTKEDEKLIQRYLDDEYEDKESLTDEEKEEAEERLVALTAAKTKDELRAEIRKLEELLTLAENTKQDSKVSKVLEFAEGLLAKDPQEKLLIFTEYRDTLDELVRVFRRKGYDPAIIHGGIDVKDRPAEEKKFADPRTNFMIATDAAGEGLNLQFCHIMVNHELPWNPNRIEQRMGRIHRYPQKNKVDVLNLLVRGTREGEIFQTLMDKLEIIRKQMGERVFDVLGILLGNTRLEDLVMELHSKRGDSKALGRMSKDLDAVLKNRQTVLDQIENESLIRERLNVAPLLERQAVSKERSIDEKDLERFLLVFTENEGGKLTKHKGGLFTIKVPKNLADEDAVKSEYQNATFSRAKARELGRYQGEFIALGHPLVDRIIMRLKGPTWGGRAAVKEDPENRQGLVFTYLVKTRDGTGRIIHEGLTSILASVPDLTCTDVNPKFIWEFQDVEGELTHAQKERLNVVATHVDAAQIKAENAALAKSNEVLKNIQERRHRELAIKRRDADEFFGHRVAESQTRLKQYELRSQMGADMKIAILGEQKRLDELKTRRDQIKERVSREENIIQEPPELVSVGIILPQGPVGTRGTPSSALKEEIEKAGMAAVMEFERDAGRNPEDVSAEFRGYDIKSTAGSQVRDIEVKSFATTGALELTENEWIMAGKLGEEYWIYAVEHARDSNKRKLNLIQNPAAKFSKVEIVPSEVRIRITDWRRSVDVSA